MTWTVCIGSGQTHVMWNIYLCLCLQFLGSLSLSAANSLTQRTNTALKCSLYLLGKNISNRHYKKHIWTMEIHSKFPKNNIQETSSMHWKGWEKTEDSEQLKWVTAGRVGILAVSVGAPTGKQRARRHKSSSLLCRITLMCSVSFQMTSPCLENEDTWLSRG